MIFCILCVCIYIYIWIWLECYFIVSDFVKICKNIWLHYRGIGDKQIAYVDDLYVNRLKIQSIAQDRDDVDNFCN